ncbi:MULTISPECIES: N-acetylglucosamine-6-phosphate deacetylase [Paraburkholderia]|jgi:N-acetylglucosamine-6-phosphate deacetylase|uniref:N-acetylglucosamine-6-phosphate deacetylase n=1 Tax=Paraburkholderia caribensis TaxID=75105 RepID=A0A9Q6WKS7_9BURK|nr:MULTISPECIES: N-acetylglucosamine-6-phosphate deacetylase [Paraburkholderia]ALP61191.1 N-acetylglucosamine-6-phosphate deacetylase [Paraburkholderia caribensis]AUT50684.1 N-acetylglucosamine-6-phosphate deacetylase [Paraburkholderia caribensis]MCO4875526.1 N-acetylglucosamine-6-phosphate deacetylase [Paraburkholderia caribensis]MDR6379818.1 N-acetylglucosamine-6-phosphate deacetylase [Paraburkholderia caribensis]PTB30550.1 N-acetylglucosamine-6-phosphate deacetylase [Paraburkholderia caribe
MLTGNILTPEGWIHGTIESENGRITAITGNAADPSTNDAPYILPGFIDLHVHGGGGADVMEAGNAIEAITRTHARFGTTSLLATTMTAPRDELMAVVAGLGDVAKNRVPGGARVLGVHLEGPYINPGKLGAQPDAAVEAVLDEVLKYLSIAPIRVVTIAPEISGHMEIISEINARGVRVQLGHSLGTYDDAVAAMKHGARSFTHLFNAMSPLHHRNPGMVGAALAHAEYAEIIPDLLHVHPGAIRAAMRAIPRLYVVTDSTSATGMPDGEYRLGSQHVTKCLGGVRLADGTLAGSTLTMDQALRNLVSLGLPMADVSNRMSRYAADYLGLEDRGRLARGAWADIVVFDRELALTATYVEGESIVEYA